MRPTFFHHLHPSSIPAEQSRLRYTLGAGGLSVYLVAVLALTGVLEMFYYVPSPQEAAQSIQQLSFLVPYGGLVRNLHYWAAQLLVLSTSIHLLRVLFTAAYAPPRRFNFLLGLGLLVLVLLLDFSGYVLRWDEGIRWALVAGTNLLKTIPLFGTALYSIVVGGSQPGPATLIRFYTWHVFGLTLVLFVLGGWHLFRVRRDGGIAIPPPELRHVPARITRFELVRREVLAILVSSALLVLLAVLAPAPLAAPIQEAREIPFEAGAPWFFLWVQQLLKLGDPFLFGILAPLGLLAILALIPYLPPRPNPAELGRWFPPQARRAQVAGAAIAALVLLLSLIALLSPAA